MHEATLSAALADLEELRQLEERYRDILDNTNDLIQILAPDGSFLYTNRKWLDALGYTPDEVRQLVLTDVLHPESLVCCTNRFARLKCGETLTAIDFKFVTKDGRAVELTGDCGSLIRDGSVIGTRGIFKDVTEQRAAERVRAYQERRYRDLFEHAPDMCFLVTRDAIIRSVNECAARELGCTVADLAGTSALDFIHPDDVDQVFAEARRVFDGELAEVDYEYRKVRKDGTTLWVQDRMRMVPVDDGMEPELLCTCRNVTESRVIKHQLEYQATHDALTGLVNRAEFETRLTRVLDSIGQHGGNHILCYLDLDQFKIVNDTCGHVAGDELLRQLADLISRYARRRDTVARLGGDEFAILMEHCDVSHAQRVCGNILQQVEAFSFTCNDCDFGIGISIGIVAIDDIEPNLANILNQADLACYAAKRAGRNRVHIRR